MTNSSRFFLCILLAFFAIANTLFGAPPGFWFAYVANTVSNNVTPVQLATGTGTAAPTSIPLPAAPANLPFAIAITPDGNTAYVVRNNSGSGDGDLIPINLLTNTAGTLIPLAAGSFPSFIAITPNGLRAYITNFSAAAITPVDITNNTAGPLIPLPGALMPMPLDIAITPSGTAAYITDVANSSVIPFDITTNTPNPLTIPVGLVPRSIAITPNGQRAYVVNAGNDSVSVIDLTTNTVIATIVGITDNPFKVAINPAGTRAYVLSVDLLNGNGTLTVIDIATNTVITAFSVGNLIQPIDLSIAPDGLTAYIANQIGNSVTPVNLVTNTVNPVIPLPADAFQPNALAITPDQAPVAFFEATKAKFCKPTLFDASQSFSPVGAIAQYAWDFGDGTTTVTTSPTITHTYLTNGTFLVTLTVTNTAGTSTTQIFTGHTMSNNGGPSAIFSREVKVLPPPIFPPKKVKGFRKINRFATQADVINILQWQPPSKGSTPRSYRIFRDSKTHLIATLSAKKRLVFKDHHRQRNCVTRYFIASVDKCGRQSKPVEVVVTPCN